jgi:hypothetical protein
VLLLHQLRRLQLRARRRLHPQLRQGLRLRHGTHQRQGLVRHRRRDRRWFSSAERWAFTSQPE